MAKPYYRPIEKETYRQPSADRLRWYQRLSAQKKCLIHVDTFMAGRTVKFAFVHKFWYSSRGASTSLYYMVPAEFFAGGTGDFIITDADWAILKKNAANGRVAYAAQDIYEYRIEKAENVQRAPIRRADTPIFRQGEKVYILSPYTWGDGESIRVLVKLPTARNMHPVAKPEDRIVMYYAHLTSTCPPTEASIIPNGSLSAT